MPSVIYTWLVENLGVQGVLIIGLGAAVVYIFKRYEKLNLKMANQAEKCRECFDRGNETALGMSTKCATQRANIEQAHSAERAETQKAHSDQIDDLYETMRKENNNLWERVDRTMTRSADATQRLAEKIGELSGRLK